MSYVKIFVTDRGTDKQTNRRTDKWVFAKVRGQNSVLNNCSVDWEFCMPSSNRLVSSWIHYQSPWRWVLGMHWLLPGLRRIISVGHVYWHDVSCWCTLVPRLCRYTTGTIHLDVCSHLCYVAFGVDCSYVVKHIRTKTVSIGIYTLCIVCRN